MKTKYNMPKMTVKTHFKCMTYKVDAELKKIEEAKEGRFYVGF